MSGERAASPNKSALPQAVPAKEANCFPPQNRQFCGGIFFSPLVVPCRAVVAQPIQNMNAFQFFFTSIFPQKGKDSFEDGKVPLFDPQSCPFPPSKLPFSKISVAQSFPRIRIFLTFYLPKQALFPFLFTSFA